MVHSAVPLTTELCESIQEHWQLEADHGSERLTGGEESASFRCGAHVVRIGPTWRTDAELEWAYTIVAAATQQVPEAIAPIPAGNGQHLVRLHGHPVSVWPYVEGDWADPEDEDQQQQAAHLLARLHRVLASLDVRTARPVSSDPGITSSPLLVDPELGRWMDRFHQRHPRRHPLHADFYRANILVQQGRISGILDWDDVFVGPPEQELAWAAWEWSAGLKTLDLQRGLRFADHYAAAGGTAAGLTREEYIQLIRDRIRMEVTYSQASGVWGTDPDEADYEASQLHAFHQLTRMATS